MMKTQTLLWAAGLGLLLATLDTGIINIALPALQTAWRVGPPQVAWAVAAYTLTLACTVLLCGQLADRTGAVRIFRAGLVVFGAASACCGAAPTLGLLVAARAVQGLGSAMIQGTAAALLADLPPARRPLAFGTLALFQALGPLLGPSVGGLVLTFASWRWLFWLNLPLTLALLVALRRHAAPSPAAPRLPLDWPGNALLLGGVAGGLLALASGGVWRLGWAALSGASWLGLARWERRAPRPLLPRRLARDGGLWAAAFAVAVVGGATALGFMVPPYTLRVLQHLAPWQIGLVNMAAPLAMVLCSRAAGRRIVQYGPTALMLGGIYLMAASFIVLAIGGGEAPLWFLAGAMLLYGLGAAAFFPSNLSALLAAAGADHQGTAGALQRMGINLGTAVDATVVGALLGIHASSGHSVSTLGVRAAWAFGAATLLAAAALLARGRSAWIGGPPSDGPQGDALAPAVPDTTN